MTNSVLNDPQHWRNRAAEARVVAQKMDDPAAKRQMLEIARSYDGIAERITRMAKGPRNIKRPV